MNRSLLTRSLFEPLRTSTLMLSVLRILFNYFVVAGHAAVTANFVLDYPHIVTDLDPDAHPLWKIWYEFIRMGLWSSVDVFLFISGFLLMPSLATLSSRNHRTSQKLTLRPLQLVEYIVSRWFRLAPLYLMAAALLANAGQDECISWSEVFFMHNWFQQWDRVVINAQACLGIGWSVHVDFQMHIVIAMLALLCSSWRNLSIALQVLIWSSAIARGFTWVKAGRPRRVFPAMADFINDERYRGLVAEFLGMESGQFDLADPSLQLRKQKIRNYTPWYSAMMYRGGAVCVGAATWIALYCNAPISGKIRAAPLLSSVFVICVWAWSYYGMVCFYSKDEVLGDWFVLWEAFGRTLLTCSIAVVVILTCTVDRRLSQQGRSFPAFRPGIRSSVTKMLISFLAMLSRASYAIYLMHPFTAWCLGRRPMAITKATYTTASIVVGGVKAYFLTVVAVIPFCIVEECVHTARKKLVRLVFSPDASSDKRGKTY